MNRGIVFDTSTLVSAALRVGSIPHTALGHALRFDTVFASEETLKELERVLGRKKGSTDIKRLKNAGIF